jgi:hypothetical protein
MLRSRITPRGIHYHEAPEPPSKRRRPWIDSRTPPAVMILSNLTTVGSGIRVAEVTDRKHGIGPVTIWLRCVRQGVRSLFTRFRRGEGAAPMGNSRVFPLLRESVSGKRADPAPFAAAVAERGRPFRGCSVVSEPIGCPGPELLSIRGSDPHALRCDRQDGTTR